MPECLIINRQTDRQTDTTIKLIQYVFGSICLPIKMISDVFRGDYITKKNTGSGDIPVILGGQEPAYYIDKANHTGEIIVIARSGASAGFVSYWNEPIFVTDGFGYEAKERVVIPKYLYYVLKNMENRLNDMKRGAGVPHISGEAISNIEIAIPPLEKQKALVGIIEKFDILCNDLEKGLPADREMDRESEQLLEEILHQYDGNENNYVNFETDPLPRSLQDSISVGYEKLQMYGVLASANTYITGAMLTLSESGKSYFNDKKNAELSEEDKTKRLVTMRKQYDVFISHANKDKNEYVDSLNAVVRKLGVNIFYDTDVLSWGDNWKQVILEGTKSSEFAIIVISNNFFGREWTERELNEFLQQQNENRQKKVLPLLYGVSLDKLKNIIRN